MVSSEHLRSGEVLSTPLSQLGILVHPFFLYDENRPRSQFYQDLTEGLYTYQLERFSPRQPDHATLVMPMRYKGERNDFCTMSWLKRSVPSSRSLFNDLKKSAVGKVLKTPDVLNYPDAYTLEKTLKVNGLTISPDTTITIGGEWLDACVLYISKKILQLPSVRGITIDKEAVVGIDEAASLESYLRAQVIAQESFIYSMQFEKGLRVEEAESEIRVIKI